MYGEKYHDKLCKKDGEKKMQKCPCDTHLNRDGQTEIYSKLYRGGMRKKGKHICICNRQIDIWIDRYNDRQTKKRR